jgi:hypothetical protein
MEPKQQNRLMKYFSTEGLPTDHQIVCEKFHDLAKLIDNSINEGAEKTVALRDAAVRATFNP